MILFKKIHLKRYARACSQCLFATLKLSRVLLHPFQLFLLLRQSCVRHQLISNDTARTGATIAFVAYVAAINRLVATLLPSTPDAFSFPFSVAALSGDGFAIWANCDFLDCLSAREDKLLLYSRFAVGGQWLVQLAVAVTYVRCLRSISSSERQVSDTPSPATLPHEGVDGGEAQADAAALSSGWSFFTDEATGGGILPQRLDGGDDVDEADEGKTTCRE